MKPSEWVNERARELERGYRTIAGIQGVDRIAADFPRCGLNYVPTIEYWRTVALAEWLDAHFDEAHVARSTFLTPELLQEEIEKRDTEPRPPSFPSVMAPDVDDGARAETSLSVTGPEPLGIPFGANGPSEAE